MSRRTELSPFEVDPEATERVPDFIVEKRTFDVQNAKGEVICRMNGTFSEELNIPEYVTFFVRTNGGTGRVLRLKDVVFVSPDGSTTVPLSEICPVASVPMYVPTERIGNYCSGWEETEEGFENRVIVPAPETAIDIGTLLHELGHADQSREEVYQKRTKAKAFIKKHSPFSSFSLSEIFSALEMVPDAFTGGDFQEADYVRMKTLIEEYAVLEGACITLAEEFEDMKQEREQEQASFIIRHVANLESVPILPESISFEQRETDLDTGHPIWEEAIDAAEENSDDERLQSARRDFISWRGRAMGISPQGNNKDSVALEWSEEKGAVLARIVITGEWSRTHFMLKLDPSADRAAFGELSRTVQDMLREEREKEKEEGEPLSAKTNAKKREIQAYIETIRPKLKEVYKRLGGALEQDATRRALTWLMKLHREHGINLIQDIAKEDRMDGVPDRPLRKNKDGEEVTSIREDLRDALRTYGADYLEMKKTKKP